MELEWKALFLFILALTFDDIIYHARLIVYFEIFYRMYTFLFYTCQWLAVVVKAQ